MAIKETINDMKNNLSVAYMQINNKGVETPDGTRNLENLSHFIQQIPTGGGSNGIYKVQSLEERDSISAKEGDICLVYKKVEKGLLAGYYTSQIKLPELVMFDTQIPEGFIMVSIYNPEERYMYQVELMIDGANANISVHRDDSYISIQYISDDGLTYIRRGEGESVFDFPTEIYYEDAQYEEVVSKFITAVTTDFEGIFQYENNSWENLDIGLSVNPLDIFVGKKAYSNNGLVKGIFGSKDADMGNIKQMVTFMEKINDFTFKATSEDFTRWSSIFSDKKIKLAPMFYVDTSELTTASYMFNNCHFLEIVPWFDTSNATDMSFMFNNNYKLKQVALLDTSNVTKMENMFHECRELEEIPSFDTSRVESFSSTFNRCTSLRKIPLLNAGKATSVYHTFYADEGLTEFGGLKDLGKAYTYKGTGYSSYSLDLSTCPLLTHDSLMNVINNLYDLNITYNVAGGGTLYKQKLVLGSTNLAKLTSEEKAIATNKGWTVS